MHIHCSPSSNPRAGSRLANTLRLYLCSVACALLLTACTPPKPTAPPIPKVTVQEPQLATVTNWDEYPGHLEAVEMVEIRPRVAGYIDSIHFQDGAEVKAGDLLFVIDPRPYQAELDQAQARTQQAGTHLELARDDLKRAESLRGTKAISEEEYDSRSKAVREGEAALAAAKASEATARLNLDFTQLKAPVSGKIGRRLVTVGNFVQLQGNGGSATLLATLVSVDPIYAYFDVEEAAYRTYRFNARTAEAKGGVVPCELALVDEKDFLHRGHLDFFDNQVNPQTGTIRLRAVFENADRTLVPGMFANLRVLAGPPEPTLLVPDVAVQSDQGYKFLYVANGESKVERRDVDIGRAHGPLRTVVKGLTPQERVIVNGLILLRPGAKVEVQEAQAQVPNPKPEAESTKAPTEGQPGTKAKPQT
jgi:RND family efflux transporter MFP subunit